MENIKYDVFISYSRKDTAVADAIIAAFKNAGITYFIDRQDVGGGVEFPAALARAIRESKIFLFLASKNSYESKFTQSEIIYAFNKKEKRDIIPYIIDGSTMPEELIFTFSAINWRNLKQHPIETTLVNDVLLNLGKPKIERKIDNSNGHEKPNVNQYDIISWLKDFRFSGRHLALIVLVLAILFLLWAIVISRDFIQNHFEVIENIIIPMVLVSFCFTIIGYIRPASLALENRKVVTKFYLSSSLVFFIVLMIIVGG